MPALLGLITTSGQVVAALTGMGLFVGIAWRGLVWFYRWLKRIERVILSIEKLIGSNGGATLFERMDMMEAKFQTLAHEMTTKRRF